MSVLPYKVTKKSRYHQIFSPIFFSQKHRPDTKKRKPRLTSVSLFSSLGNRSETPDLTLDDCPKAMISDYRFFPLPKISAWVPVR